MRNIVAGVASLLISMTAIAQQVAKGLTAKNGEYIGFYQYTPTDYSANPNTKYPLIIFLHGIGERGDGKSNLSSVLWNGIPRNIQDGHTMRFTWNGKTETFLVLTPQLNSKYGWWPTFYVEEMINYATANLRVDPNRIIVTGLSLGGGGTWDYAGSSLTNAQKLAAIGVCCGTCQSVDWCNIANAKLPVWAFHAADDGTVGVGCTNGSITSINKCNPAVKPYMTIWPSGNHWIWDRVYSTDYSNQNPNIYEWFLAQNKSLPVNVRPIARAGSDINITTAQASASLNAGTSSDADGTIVRYVWNKLDGPSFGTITTPVSTNGATTVTGLTEPGTYRYVVKVIDSRADWTFDTVAVIVKASSSPANKPPVANAGTASTITLPTNNSTLNGSQSTDPDGYLTGYSWSKVSGPTQGTIAQPASATTAISNLVQGTYTFKLTVTDNNNTKSEATVNVTVNGSTTAKPYVINAGKDTSITLPATSAVLDGSASYDSRGPLKQFEWTKIAGPAQYTIASNTSLKTTVTNLAQGVYTFRLVVWNNAWEPRDDTMKITVNASTGNPPPTTRYANAGKDTTITLPANSAFLDASASYDPRGPMKQFEWSKLSGPSQYNIADRTAMKTALTNLVEGTYVFRLVAWNNAWEPKDDTVKVTVKPGTTTPPSTRYANAGKDTTITLPANSATLDASASYDPRGPMKQFEWTKLSGPAQYTIADRTAMKTAVTNLTEGVYTFRLVAWNNAWEPKDDTVKITVNPGTITGIWRAANAGQDVFITLPQNSATLNGSASSDPRGPVKQFEWTKLTGPNQYTITDKTAAVTTVYNLAQGAYTFRLVVWNNKWEPTDDTVAIVVGSNATPEIANAGADIFLTLPVNSTTLNGSASSDPKGPIKQYEWSRISGPATYTIANPASSVTTLYNLVKGVYTFRLVVWDNSWVPRADTVVVSVTDGTTASRASNNTTTASAGNIAVTTTPPKVNPGAAGSNSTTPATSGTAVASTVNAETAKASVTVAEKLLAYPNPAISAITLQCASKYNGTVQVLIFDVNGTVVRKQLFTKVQTVQQQTIRVDGLLSGIYLVELLINGRQQLTTRFLKK